DFCRTEGIMLTRSRPYKKNDPCFVEQKNGAVVRRWVGYDRYEGLDACTLLAALYAVLRRYINYFQPSMKLVHKVRTGARVTKTYDRAQTPCERLLASP
ncbi:MAG TPA: transposase, partial [Gammaproteobacteria bacterium]|nr:transposase [Gammaproteobacteria bacterium]